MRRPIVIFYEASYSHNRKSHLERQPFDPRLKEVARKWRLSYHRIERTMASETEIRRAVERDWIWRPQVHGLRVVEREGILGTITTISTIVLNNISWVQLTEDSADRVIREVHELFTGSRDRRYSWWVSELATPNDMGDRLLQFGLRRLDEGVTGMALSNLDRPIPASPEVTVRKAEPSDEDMSEVARIFSVSDFLEADTGPWAARWFQAADGSMGTRTYLAFLPEVDRPVAAASMWNVMGGRVVYLAGAATLPEYRGRGTYTALLARRLQEARADGADGAVIHASIHSVPICRKHGFRDISSYAIYFWDPTGRLGS